MSRQSVWPSAPPPSDHLNYLEDCISATENCVVSLTHTLQKFEPGIKDFPRLTRIFVNEHKYLVLPQPIIQTHLSSTSASLGPDIQRLLHRAETLVEAEKTKLHGIEKTIKILQSASIPAPTRSQEDLEEGEKEGDIWSSKTDGLEMKGLDMVQIKKIRMLRNKRERLEKERVKLGLI